MINLYSGTPGSGKSLDTAISIFRWINTRNRPVICNFQIDTTIFKRKRKGGFLYVPNLFLTPDFLIDYSEQYREKVLHKRKVKEDSILLVIDEAQLLFNSRSWQNKDRAKWLEFFTQHRKLGYYIILACQDICMLDKQIRAIIEHEYEHRKLKNMGIYGNIVNILKGGNTCLCLKTYLPTNDRVGKFYIKIRPKYYMIYDTNNLFNEV